MHIFSDVYSTGQLVCMMISLLLFMKLWYLIIFIVSPVVAAAAEDDVVLEYVERSSDAALTVSREHQE